MKPCVSVHALTHTKLEVDEMFSSLAGTSDLQPATVPRERERERDGKNIDRARSPEMDNLSFT